jgi:hypothetical protein
MCFKYLNYLHSVVLVVLVLVLVVVVVVTVTVSEVEVVAEVEVEIVKFSSVVVKFKIDDLNVISFKESFPF